MSVMKIAGKNGSSAVGVAVTENGDVKSSRVWRNSATKIYDGLPEFIASGATTATAIALDSVDVSEVGAFSLRILNDTDQDITFTFHMDVETGHSYTVKGANGYTVSFVVSAGNKVAITPDDVPVMQWLRLLRLVFKASANPASGGNLKIYVLTKG